ncbi:MAG: MFS transporter [Burkholderiales bacterium]|jgi:AAA family ATP:ADP antiporter|nr:MFS transporter [Burkholderiales bacterium]
MTRAAIPRLQKLVLLRPGEGCALLWAAGYFFFLLLALYLLRPVREAMGIARGADKLPWLMTTTLLVMLVANPLYAALMSRLPRRRFIPLVSHFFAANLLALAALFYGLPEHGGSLLGYAFYVWLSVFNLFVVSVFWSLMTDVFSEDQGKRLFGMISMGGTLGAVVGAAVTEGVSGGSWGFKVEPAGLMLLAALGLELAVVCMLRLAAHFQLSLGEGQQAREPGPDFKAGLSAIAGSRYLQLICAYMLLFTITSTFLYLMQGDIVARSFASGAERTAAFARLDVWTNVLTLSVQLLLTSRLLRGIGVSGVLLVLPLLTTMGFGAPALWPGFAVLAFVQVLRRGLHYAVDRPAREILYIPLGPEERYKSKAFIDTFVFRGGDFLGVWAPSFFSALAVPVALAALGSAGGWVAVAAWLGRLVRGRPGRQAEAPPLKFSHKETSP